jgi:CBS domain containing-hemolysin-like protein
MNDTQASSTESGGETVSTSDASDRSGESWFDRLLLAVGLRQSAADIRENLESVLDTEDGADAVFSPLERMMIRKILHLKETRVEDVMVPRSSIDAVPADSDLASVMIAFSRTGRSRMPVFRESLDDAFGMIHIRDLMDWIARSAAGETIDNNPSDDAPQSVSLASVDLTTPLNETKLVRNVLFVPASMPATDLLARMQANRIQIALVIDEYGGVDGLVSLEDIVETVVGDIEDEHDTGEDEGTVQSAGDGVWIADGSVVLEDVTKLTGIDFGPSGLEEDVDTLGGLAFALFGRVPSVGEELSTELLPRIVFEVLDADSRRIKRLRLRLVDIETKSASLPPLAVPFAVTSDD